VKTNLKVLLLSIGDSGGGAARASYRLHVGLQNVGVFSRMMVQTKLTEDLTVLEPRGKVFKGIALLRPTLNALPLRVYPQSDFKTYSLQWLPECVSNSASKLELDLLNLHWVCDGFLKIETLPYFKCPLVWTLHDMWPFTGGCHYSGDCDRYTEHCGCCPQLGSSKAFDLSAWVWHRKAKNFSSLNLTLVTPSRWLANCAQSSSLFRGRRIEVIPNGLDLQIYKPIDSRMARQILNLPQDKKLILFGAVRATSDRRKGFHLLQPALHQLRQITQHDNIQLVIMGAPAPPQPLDLGFETHYLGTLRDDYSLALAYAAADVFVAPSVQDNLPNTVLEAIACGIPCVAFDIGGMPDLIKHKQNGYLALPYETEDFARGINWVLGDRDRWQKLSEASRSKAEQEFSLTLQASRYRDLFQEIVEASRKQTHDRSR
jgi:glycosyltransferase involved in cell wall biosynthesis